MTDRRYRCRSCGKPRFRAVALLPDRNREAYWAGPLCHDGPECTEFAAHDAPAFGPDRQELAELDKAMEDQP